MSNLYQIELEYQELLRTAEEQDGVLDDEQNKALDITLEDFAKKSEQYAKIIRNLEGDIAFAEKEIERINKFIGTKTNIIERLKQNLLDAVILFGEKDKKKDIWRYEIETFKFSTRKSSQVIVDEEKIDNKWKQVNISEKFTLDELNKINTLLERNVEAKTSVLKTPIKEAIEKGEFVEGASIQEKFGLTIK